MARGLDPNHAVLVMVMTALFVDCLAFVALELPALPANLIFLGCLIAYGAAFFVLDSPRWTERLVSPQT